MIIRQIQPGFAMIVLYMLPICCFVFNS